MFDDAGKVKFDYFKAQKDKRGKIQGFGKPYNKDKGKKRESGGGSKASLEDVRCFKCGTLGHYANDSKNGDKCFRCGQAGHKSADCKKEITCYNCGEKGHIST
ncbi:zinc finger protein GIS2-like [Medicago truncatula]|uniref:zinc finger protein GIS2-like n=1 Tax=Medicago truncatula TaxID=3880 RepID=UPI0019687CFC|nr:zinc finger protein GIS2-like [Medicago truncatula]